MVCAMNAMSKIAGHCAQPSPPFCPPPQAGEGREGAEGLCFSHSVRQSCHGVLAWGCRAFFARPNTPNPTVPRLRRRVGWRRIQRTHHASAENCAAAPSLSSPLGARASRPPHRHERKDAGETPAFPGRSVGRGPASSMTDSGGKRVNERVLLNDGYQVSGSEPCSGFHRRA
jgi:hypothetical protein